MTGPTRRSLVGSLAAAAAAAGLPARLALAAAPTDRRFVLVILRGGLDGLAAVPPWGDPAYQAARPNLALAPPGATDGVIDLGSGFGLHPALAALEPLFRRREMLVLHAIASPYRGRSHFDGQDVLELGAAAPGGVRDGWLNRALTALGGQTPATGLALAQALPLVLRGAAPADSWAPSRLPQPRDRLMQAILELYRDDPLLGPALRRGLDMRGMAEAALGPEDREAGRGARGPEALATLAQAAGRLLAQPAGPRVAVLEIGGWDTHAGQGAAAGALAGRLAVLGDGLASLSGSLGPVWRRSIVAVVTEFGRTVAENGTRGTDHGTAAAAFLLGGAVAGGRVLGDWPGLSPARLFEGRDLRPTLDLRAAFKGVLGDHLGIARARLDRDVFPDSGGVVPLAGLVAV